jgi:hypothetical protein
LRLERESKLAWVQRFPNEFREESEEKIMIKKLQRIEKSVEYLHHLASKSQLKLQSTHNSKPHPITIFNSRKEEGVILAAAPEP